MMRTREFFKINQWYKWEGTLSRMVLTKEEVLKLSVGNISTWGPTWELK